jgi:thiol-disulfide isomerase/thioredoxin
VASWLRVSPKEGRSAETLRVHTSRMTPNALRLLRGLATALALAVAGAATNAAEPPAVPDVPLVSLAGAPVSLPRLVEGRPAVVNLWATWCPPCREEMPMLAAAQEREADRMRFVFADQGESPQAVRRYLDDEILTPLEHVLLDAGSALRRKAGARGLPTTLFFDASGRLVDRHVGPLSRDELRAKVDALRGSR